MVIKNLKFDLDFINSKEKISSSQNWKEDSLVY
jgi:hypothetical protein